MAIDIYLGWKSEEEEQRTEEITYSRTGDAGYLHEAYHGGLYVTEFLVPEVFRSETGDAEIPAAVLRERLPEALDLAEERLRTLYGETDPEVIADEKRTFIDFVELAEAKERALGEPCTVTIVY